MYHVIVKPSPAVRKMVVDTLVNEFGFRRPSHNHENLSIDIAFKSILGCRGDESEINDDNHKVVTVEELFGLVEKVAKPKLRPFTSSEMASLLGARLKNKSTRECVVVTQYDPNDGTIYADDYYDRNDVFDHFEIIVGIDAEGNMTTRPCGVEE